VYIYGSYRKNKIGVPFFWTTRYMQSALYAIVRVRLSNTRVDQPKSVEVGIIQLSSQSSQIPLVFAV